MKTLISALLAILTLLPCLVAKEDSHSEALIETWIDGYLNDFREHSKLLRNEYPLTVQTFDYSKKKPQVTELEIEDQETIRTILEMIIGDVESLAKEQNWIDENGERKRRIKHQFHARPQMRLKWNIEGMIVGYQLDANGVEFYQKYDSKKAQVLYQKRTCRPDLAQRIKETYNQSAHTTPASAPR